MIKKKVESDSGSMVLSILRRGGIVILPCDTIYGIVGRCSDTEQRIRKCKGRDKKPFLRLIPDAQAVSSYTDNLPSKPLLALWPGPLTLVVAGTEGGTTALRVPNDPFLAVILEQMSEHLFSTSVNMTGEDALWKIDEIVEKFDGMVDLILDAGDLPGRKPSTVLDVTRHPYKIVRHGACEISPELLI